MNGRKSNSGYSSISFLFLLKICCLTFLLSGNFLFAQEVQVEGKVTDSLNNPIEYIQVSMEKAETSSIIAYTITDVEGRYELDVPNPGNFELVFRGMTVETKRITLDTELGKKEYLKDVQLRPKLEELDEVILESKNSITVRKDTVVINPSAFKEGNEEVLEDLLKKLPGITVGSDGTIKVGNRAIKKVMVEGDDFFGGGYKLLTKNMDYDAIKDVEIYRNYSNNPLLKGIQESNDVALNLTLKEEKKYEWFGNINAGYDLLDSRHMGRMNLMSFGKANKFYFLSNINNIGIDSKGDLSDLLEASTLGNVSELGEDEQVTSFYEQDERIPFLKDTRTRFNNSRLGSLNGIFNLNEKLKVKLLGFLEWDERDLMRESLREYTIENTSFTNRESLIRDRKEFSAFGTINAKYDFTDMSFLELHSTYSQQRRDAQVDVAFDEETFQDLLEERNELINTQLNYTHKLTEQQAISLSGFFRKESFPQEYSTNRSGLDSLFPAGGTSSTITQDMDQQKSFKGVAANYFNRISEQKLLEVEVGFLETRNELVSHIANSEGTDLGMFSNDFEYLKRFVYLKPEFTFSFQDFSLSGGLGLTKYFNQLKPATKVNEEDEPLLLNPELGFNWDLDSRNKITGSYYHNSESLGVKEILPEYYLSDYRSLRKGIGRPRQLRESGIFLTYSLGNWGDRYFINTFLSYTKNRDYVSTIGSITPDFEHLQNALFNNQELFTINSNFDRFIKPLNSNIKLKGGYSRSDFEKIVNGEPYRAEAENFLYGVEFKSAFHGAFNFHLGSEWNTSAINEVADLESTRILTFLDMSYALSDRFHLSLQSERYSYKTNDYSSKAMYFLDLNLRYTLINNKLSLQIHGQNLLNTSSFEDYFITDISRNRTDYRILPRFLLLKLNYRF